MEAVLRPITEVAAELRVSRDTLERLIGKNKLAKYRKDGDRRTFVDDEQARAALGFRRVSGPEPGAPVGDQ
jgi:excisionase family DNA binding protein